MDLNPIGKHCALQSCNALDFLPIQCNCLQWFCRLHISPDLHGCSFMQQRPPDPSPSTPVRAECAFLGCNRPSLATSSTTLGLTREGESCGATSSGCHGCQLDFCVNHRHMQSHSCIGPTAGKDDVKHEVARAVLAQKFSATSMPSHTPVVARRQRTHPSDPRKLAQLQKVNLMRLRHKAVPGDHKDKNSVVPIDQRLHIIVRLEIAGQPAKEVALWFRKTTTTGKVLDLVGQYFGVSHTTSTLHLIQSSAATGSYVLQNHLELSGQLEDGSTVALSDSVTRLTVLD